MGVEVEWGRKKTLLRFDRHQVDCHPFGYEPEVVNVIERFVEPGDCVVDAGACIGFHTCLMSKLVGEDGVVLAFEPQLESFKYLFHHVHVANKLNNVACLRMALWKCDCPELVLWSVEDIGYSSFHKYADFTGTEKVEGRSLDTLLIEDHPRFIKIDCEGTEAEVLLGAHSILEKGVDCVVLEFNYHMMRQTGRSDGPIRQYMAALGYDLFLISVRDDNGGFLPPIKVAPDVAITLSGGHHINVMFSTEEKVRSRW